MAGIGNQIGITNKVSYTSNKFITDQSRIGWKPVILAAAARDASKTPTTLLGEGLVVGKITASDKYAQYDDSAVDGTEVADLILAEDVDLVDPETNVATDSTGLCVYSGRVDNDALNGINAAGRTDLAGRIYFDNV